MAKSPHTKLLFTRFYCDKHTCDETLDIPADPDLNNWENGSAADQAAAAHGWSAWKGRRSRYEYCPAHKPGRNAEVTRLW